MLSCLLISVACSAAAQPVRSEACAHFDNGAKLVQLHIYEAEGGTREGVAEGMRELKAALDGGCPKVAETLVLLGDAAWVYASQHSVSSEEGRSYEEFARDSYRKYLDLRPDDSRARYTYAVIMLHNGTREQRRQLEELVRRDPKHAGGRLALGRRLIDQGEVEAGAAHLVAAAKLFDRFQADDYGHQVVETLQKHGRKKDAAEAKKDIDAKLKGAPDRGR